MAKRLPSPGLQVQDIVGSVVKTAEDDDPIAVFTVLNTQTHQEQEWMKQLRAFLGGKAKDDLKQKLSEVRCGRRCHRVSLLRLCLKRRASQTVSNRCEPAHHPRLKLTAFRLLSRPYADGPLRVSLVSATSTHGPITFATDGQLLPPACPLAGI